MREEDLEARLTAIEIMLTHQQKALEELSEMTVKQGKEIDFLVKQCAQFRDALADMEVVKPLSEETPPPHY